MAIDMEYALGDPGPVTFTSFSGANCIPILNDQELGFITCVSFEVHYRWGGAHEVEGHFIEPFHSGNKVHNIISEQGVHRFQLVLGNEYGSGAVIDFVDPKINSMCLDMSVESIFLDQIFEFTAKELRYPSE